MMSKSIGIKKPNKKETEKCTRSKKTVNNPNYEQSASIFQEVIVLINQKNKLYLGPEKSKAARFIAENQKEILHILKTNLNRKERDD